MIGKDYIIVEDNKNVILRFNNRIIEIFEDLRKKDYSDAKENCTRLIVLYDKMGIDDKRKTALGVLLSEIKNQIEINVLKENINKEIGWNKLIKSKKEYKELDKLHRLIEAKKLKEYKLRNIKYNPEIPRIKYKEEKEIIKNNELSEVRELIKKGKIQDAKKLLG